ncbi:uncharacterized protein [Rutidosis leptorrhynchoides]|uniref:uncharacterized protein n=1 Tax=Rutidosis leptorrhynchoides TaxID=125765 RepID=UPI003A99309E
MANRLKPWLPMLIAEEQTAFMSNKLIQDNIFIVQEVIHLLKLGFHARWVQWIKICISSISFNILINGEPSAEFKPTRGIRQGDPFSPYLFIIMTNILSTLMRKAIQDETIKGIRLNPTCPTLSHLLFADDAILFLDGTIREAQNVSNVLNQYCYVTSQAINLNKSRLFVGKSCPPHLKQNLASELRVAITEHLGKYLGIPANLGKTKKQMFAWMLTRVERKLEGWKEKLISKAGKEILIKAIIQTIPQYQKKAIDHHRADRVFHIIEPATGWKIGDGKTIKIHEDLWLPTRRLIGPANKEEPRLVADLIESDSKKWNVNRVTALFQENIANEILAQPLCLHSRPDKLVWTANKSGIYTIKSGYNRMHSSATHPNNQQLSPSYQTPKLLWPTIWKLPTSPKIRFLIWNICNNSLTTKENLHRRKMIPDLLCQICGQAPETMERLFILCGWTKIVWLDPQNQADTNPKHITIIDKWIFENLTTRIDDRSKALFAALLWNIWLTRNAAIFRGIKPAPSHTQENAWITANLHLKWGKQGKKPSNSIAPDRTSCETWKPPDLFSSKLNVDVAWSSSN